MGEFLVNVFVRSDDQSAVARAARAVLGERYGRGSSAPAASPVLFVSPSMAGWVGVHDCAMQGQDEILCGAVARELSAQLGSTAITFLVHDGDFLCYWLASRGALLDHYISMPDYFRPPDGPKPSGGNAARLADACGKPDQVSDLAKLLQGPGTDAFDRLKRLGALLAIPDATVDYRLLIDSDSPSAPAIRERERYMAFTRADLT